MLQKRVFLEVHLLDLLRQLMLRLLDMVLLNFLLDVPMLMGHFSPLNDLIPEHLLLSLHLVLKPLGIKGNLLH